MLAKISGLILLVIGGVIAFKVATALIGILLGRVGVAIVLIIPAALLYWGYRMVTRDRRAEVYY